MNYWKYTLINAETGDFVCSDGFFETEEDAETSAWQKIERCRMPGTYKIVTAQHWSETDDDELSSNVDDYVSTVKAAVKDMAAAAGMDPAEYTDELCDVIHDDLAEEFHGCHPEYRTLEDDDGQQLKLFCFYDTCRYGCRKCPMLCADGIFLEYIPNDKAKPDDTSALAEDLLRIVKCDGTCKPSEEEIRRAVKFVTKER